MIEIFNEKYKNLSIAKVIISVKKYNKKGVLSKKEKLLSIEKYLGNGYLSEKSEFYADEKSFKHKYLFDFDKKTLEKTHYFLNGNVEYKNIWRFDKNDRLIQESKFHFNYANSIGKQVLGRNWLGEYDTKGNLLSSIQYSHGKEVEEAFYFKYDSEGKLIENNTDNYRWNYIYDEYGLQIQIIRTEVFLSEKTDYKWEMKYDKDNQLIEKIRFLNDEVDYIQQWEHQNGNIVLKKEVIFENGEINEYCNYYEYTDDKRILRENNDTLITNYKYNEDKKLIEKTSSYHDGRILNKQINTWNELGLLMELQENKEEDIPKQITKYDYE